ncbi:DUF58 domain-containing protein [Flavobacteriaceae bacterium R38]|nr:DUF58 domain-containing protein [Flavobacteriaceae bacterium R38]
MKLFRPFYIQPRFFYIGIGIIALFVISYFIPVLFNVTRLVLLSFIVFFLSDTLVLFLSSSKVHGIRKVPEKFSNGDFNLIKVQLENNYPFAVTLQIVDELPEQFQKRDFNITKTLKSKEKSEITYQLRPTERGEYHFGSLNIYTSSVLGLAARRFRYNSNAMVPTYPSFIQLRKFELLSISNNLQEYGVKKIRRIGHTMEFEQIKEYVSGDDIRTLNWKATAKRNQLMVNQFQDERAQSVYSVIDKGRVMKMPFNGLSLLDYAINSSLIISSVVLRKQDKAGVFSFSKKVNNMVVAQRRSVQMQMILEALYNVKTDFYESDYSRLYAEIKRNIPHRSLILLYTNFETMDGLHRQLPYLKAITKSHLLVVIFFKNTEIQKITTQSAKTVKDVYDKVIAEKFAFEKKLIVNELKKYGIYSILTTPENLTIDTINKYLEIKSRGLL